MFEQGLYKIAYRSLGLNAAEPESALAILRDGKILGSDRNGGVFSGRVEFNPVLALSNVHLKIDVPPDGELITGFAAGSAGATLDIIGHFGAPNPASKAILDVAGGQIEVELSYLGPLPD